MAGTGFHFSKETRRGDPQPFFYSNLLNLWHDLQNETRVLVVLLDDVQHFSSISVIMSVLRNVLADEKIVKETKFLFVLASTFDGWKPFLQRNHPIGRYFTPRMKLTNLAEEETYRLIEKHLKDSGVTFSKEVRRLIYRYTNGHLYETHVLCSHLFQNQLRGKVTSRVFEPALERTLVTLGEEIFNWLFDSASENEQLILSILAEYEGACSFGEILPLAEGHFDISKNLLANILERLVSKRIISKPRRGVYSVDDTLFRTFITRKMGKVDKVSK